MAASTTRSDIAVDGKQLRRVFDEALRDLPTEQREVFCMREYGGLGFKEIAEAVGANENTIKSRMRYALTSLQRALGRAGLAPETGCDARASRARAAPIERTTPRSSTRTLERDSSPDDRARNPRPRSAPGLLVPRAARRRSTRARGSSLVRRSAARRARGAARDACVRR